MTGDVAFDHDSNAHEETMVFFSALDTSRDNSLSPDEFAEGLRQHLNLVSAVILFLFVDAFDRSLSYLAVYSNGNCFEHND